ncbi:hypothetical protein ACFS07_31405 [Undibacterium arcticum]
MRRRSALLHWPPCQRWRQKKKSSQRFFNWSEFIADDTIKKTLKKETGIKVRYDNYDSNEILHAKLTAGKNWLRYCGAGGALGQSANPGAACYAK